MRAEREAPREILKRERYLRELLRDQVSDLYMDSREKTDGTCLLTDHVTEEGISKERALKRQLRW